MKKLVLALTLLSILPIMAEGSMNIVFVDMNELFNNYYKKGSSEDKIKEQEAIFKDYHASLFEQAKELQSKGKKCRELSQNIALSNVEREKNKKEFEEASARLSAKTREIKDYEKETQEKLAKLYMETRNELVEEISGKLKEIAKEESYDLILDVSGVSYNNKIRNVVYYDKTKDITEKVLEILNKDAEKSEEKND
ncbi:MAG: OmpH family outer membrane protein [Verrucomicrobiota bacterium]|nr:OmpH family outer membrane protein [Verrucomicrobiota bacterium]